jgi:hypothetical protein
MSKESWKGSKIEPLIKHCRHMQLRREMENGRAKTNPRNRITLKITQRKVMIKVNLHHKALVQIKIRRGSSI